MDRLNLINQTIKSIILFLIMGFVYMLIEYVWRSTWYWQMYPIGGLSGLLIGYINEFFDWKTPLWKQVLIGDLVVLGVEFISGLILNVWLGFNIWDYSMLLFNVCGQVSLLYAVLWLPVVLFGIVLDDLLRWFIFGEKFEGYNIL